MRRSIIAVLLGILTGAASGETPVAPTTSPDRLIVQLQLIHGDKAAKAFLGPGALLHGREFGPAVRSAMRREEIKVHLGQFLFTVELRDFDYASMRGGMIRLSRMEEGRLVLKESPIPPDFGAPDQWGRPRHTIGIDVLDGVGWVEVRVPWVGDGGFLVARAPEGLPLARPKPPHRALMTCPRQYVAANLCGTFTDPKLSELANLVRHAAQRVTDIKFVTDERE
ncbi:MAG: hypothetical protein Q8R35_01475 [bacterium]|nr:hypothetical protein [bacterium]